MHKSNCATKHQKTSVSCSPYVKSTFIVIMLLAYFSGLIIAQAPMGFQQTPRIKKSLNQAWKFYLGNPDSTFYRRDYDDSGWELVHIPHTLQLTSLNLDDCEDDKLQETFHRTVGWYRKQLFVEPSERKVFLEFEGAHQVTDLWVNGRHIGQHKVGGYTPFHFDITEFVIKGVNNQVTLLVDNRKRDDVPPDPGPFDYVKFSGLYRDIYQVESHPVRITFNWESLQAGLTFTTPSVDPINGNATIDVKTVVRNETDDTKSVTVVNRLIDHEGIVVLRLEQSKDIDAGRDIEFSQIGGLEDDVHLWSIDRPYLYRLNTLIYADGKVLDGNEIKVGIRKFEHHPREGFLLNGQPIKLIGMNRHQSLAYVGDALPNSIHRKDMLQFKELGLNIIRTAHYPQDDALIDACDELGILVYEEAPTWIDIGNDEWFDQLDQASRTMIRNHRNHPSVVIWGAGINHRGYVPRLHYAAKQEDPSRLTASQSSRWTGWQTSGLTDIYGQMLYGPVQWHRHEPMLAMEGREGIQELARYKMDPLLTGIISWAAHDHYTFHPPYGNQRGRIRPVGAMTVFRQPYPETFFYPIELKNEPQLHIASDWVESTHEVVVYSNTETVELLINDKSIEKHGPDRSGMMSALDHPPFRFTLDRFEPGKLTARGWTGSQMLVEQSIYTPLQADRITLTVDTSSREFIADGSDILLAHAYITDRNGTVIDLNEYEVTFSVEGPASIVGDAEHIGSNPMVTRDGVAEVLVRSGLTPGLITLNAHSEGLNPAKVNFQSEEYKPGNLAETKLFYDVESLKVDIGSPEQLLQYEWTPWNGQDGATASQTFEEFNGISAKISAKSNDGLLRWLGEMNVMGKYGYAMGEGLLSLDEDGLIMKIGKLSAGKYLLITYHHAPRSNTDSMDPNRDRLQTVKVTDIPYAEQVSVKLVCDGSSQSKRVNVSSGNMLPDTGPGNATFNFELSGDDQLEIHMSGLGSRKNVWFSAFELKRFIP